MLADAPIVACLTPWGAGAVSALRLSGSGLPEILARLCQPGRLPPPRHARLVRFRDAGGFFDEGLLLWMPGPRSWTGEDVAELSCHGNPLIVDRLLQACIDAGARMARPGEFSRRAVLNGRMDLCRAEAVLQTLSATSAAGLELARQGREGRISGVAEALRAELADIAADLEAILDYPGEDLLLPDDAAIRARLLAQAAEADRISDTFRAGRLAIQGARVALVGPVNAGKSSLFNALLGRSRALVSPIPGTTRDIVESPLQLPGVQVLLLDTAGLRASGAPATDPIEQAGLDLAAGLIAEADLRLLVWDGSAAPPDLDRYAALGPCLHVRTHADLCAAPPDPAAPDPATLPVSSRTGAGMEALKIAIQAALVGEEPGGIGLRLASERQRDLFRAAAAAARAAAEALPSGGPAVAAERLYEGLEALDSLTGRETRESVMDRLFEKFCVGK